MALAVAAFPAFGKELLVFGDSLSAAYGMPERRGWVALLQERLKRERPDYSVANASISGETTAGGRARLAKVLAQHKPAVVVLALGANDGLRGLPVAAMKQNLATMIEQSQKAGARVLLVGMRLPPNYGQAYTSGFEATFREVARSKKIRLLPFLLAPVAADRAAFQADGLHPAAAAQPKLLEPIWRALQPLLK